MLPKHLDFAERAKTHHPDVFKAQSWVSVESRHLGGGYAYVGGERVDFVAIRVRNGEEP